jgi:hypothetical protein
MFELLKYGFYISFANFFVATILHAIVKSKADDDILAERLSNGATVSMLFSMMWVAFLCGLGFFQYVRDLLQ